MSPTIVRFIVLVALGLVAAVVAWRFQQRRPDPPSAPSYRAPTQLNLADFGLGEDASRRTGESDRQPRPAGATAHAGAFAVVVFGSELCSSCAGVWATVEAVVPKAIIAKLVNLEDDPNLHKRYRIDGVPTLVVIDYQGVVRNAFFGPVSDETLAQSLLSD